VAWQAIAEGNFRLSLSPTTLFPQREGSSNFEVGGFLAVCWHLKENSGDRKGWGWSCMGFKHP